MTRFSILAATLVLMAEIAMNRLRRSRRAQ